MTDWEADPAASVEFAALGMRFGDQVLFGNFSASIAAGEFIAVLGPNGAGKSTLFKLMLGLVAPSSGQIAVLGRPPARGNALIGYLPQRRSQEASDTLSGRAHLQAVVNGHRWGCSFPGAAADAAVRSALALVDAEAFMDRPLARLSGGERQRIALAQALLGEPRLLLLDEPLISLDPRRQRELVQLIDSVRKRLKITVLFVSHDVNPLLPAIDRVLYLADGRASLGPAGEAITADALARLYQLPLSGRPAEGSLETVRSRN